MNTITFTCETITPMFLAGADGTTPELRPPSIKGAMRFWWRALNGHLGLEELRAQEGAIFGDTKQRSKVIINILEQPIEKGSTFLLPHKSSSLSNAFSPNETFTVELKLLNPVKLPNSNSIFSIEQLQDLFIITCTLGGFGKRSRRGFGSVKITKIKLDKEPEKYFSMPQTIETILQYLPIKYFEPSEGKIVSKFERNEKYPYIKEIEIGKYFDNLRSVIIQASHDIKGEEYERAKNIAIHNEDYRKFFDKRRNQEVSEPNSRKYSNFEKAIGDGSDRFASPIYVSSLTENLPIITILNHIPPKTNSKQEHLDLQEKFRKKISNA